MKTLRAAFLSLRAVSVFGILSATTAPVVLAGPADDAEEIASLAGFHGGLATIFSSRSVSLPQAATCR
jgi:hypothetical protein